MKKPRAVHAKYPGIYVPRCAHPFSDENPELLFTEDRRAVTCERCLRSLAKSDREDREAHERAAGRRAA